MMNKLFLIISVLLILACAEEPLREVSPNRLVVRNGLTYEVNTDTPFSGVSIKNYELGGPREMITYQDGLREGPTETYNLDGFITSVANFVNGDELDFTYFEYDDFGKLVLLEIFKNGGKAESTRFYYYDSGPLELKISDLGDDLGVSESYYENGQLNVKEFYRYIEPTSPFSSGLQTHGPVEWYSENGQLLMRTTYEEGVDVGPCEGPECQ